MRNAASHEKRCSWVNMNDPLLVEYHDHEWGVPVHGDNRHLEVLVLSGAQAGLNWSLVLKKRDSYRRAFDGFDPDRVARYTGKRIEKLLVDPTIIRNRMKIEAAVTNARALLEVRPRAAQVQSLGSYLTDPGDFSRIRGVQQRSEAAGIQFRRSNGHVCVHAVGWISKRPSR